MRYTVPHRRSVLWLIIAICATCVFGSPEPATAQPVLTFTRITNNWPTIELYFKVSCDGAAAYPTSKQFFKVYEEGIEIGEFTLWCPDPRQRCAISVAMVFDASGSMQGPGNQGAKAAGNAFIDLMDGIVDEAAVIWFTTDVNVELGMTTNKTDLHDAVNALPANGGTHAWDGIYVGLQELLLSGSNPCRAVIALTDGVSSGDTHTPDEIIALANRNRIRVFTIGLGGVAPAQLETIAMLTGGKYYQAPTPDQLVRIYEEISTIIQGGFLECMITYQAKCQDGGLREVDLTIFNFCHGGSDTKTRSYRAPKDPTTYTDLEIELGRGEGTGGSDVTIPLNLNTPISPKDNFYPSTFTIMFDPDCVQLRKFSTPPGTLLNGVPITVEPINGGIKVKTEERIILEGSGPLAELTFALSDVDDSTCCEIDLSTWVFEAGCFNPVLKSNEICINPRRPDVNCQLVMRRELSWVRSIKDYSPNPFDVKMVVSNSGDKEAKNVMFKIDYDPADFDLRSPISDLQPGTPVDVAVNGISEATWNLLAKTRLSGDSVEVCITAMMDNHEDVTCCSKIWIPPTEPILECTINPVQIVADNDNQRYNPMPFEFSVNVLNRGGMKSEEVTATISVPPDLALADPDAPDKFTKVVSPKQLLPNQSGYVSWMLTHPITLEMKEYIVRVWVKTGNADSSLCEGKITIPPLDAPSIRATCTTPADIVFDENADVYNPNPFTISLTAVNLGKMAADDVTAFLYLPENVVFEPAGQDPRVDFGRLNKWQTGDPIITKSWTVKWTKRFRYDAVAEFRWAVAGVGQTGIPTDSVYTICRTNIPGLKPSFKCTVTAPDRIVLNAEETANEPNPFDFTYTITNTSKQTASIKRLSCSYTNDGLELDGIPGNTADRLVDISMAPGDVQSFTWTFKVSGRITLRNARITVTAFDDEGNPVTCEQDIPIDPLKTALICEMKTDDPVIHYSQVLQSYTNPTFVGTATLTNTGGFNLSNVTTEVSIANNTGGWIEFDPNYSDNSNPKDRPVLFQGQSFDFEWGFRLAKPNTTGVVQVVEICVAYASNETARIEGACCLLIQIEPVLMPSLVCTLQAPDRIRFDTDHYDPDVFDVNLRVENLGNGDAQNVMAYVLQDERFTVIAGANILQLGTILPGTANDFSQNAGFQLKVKPRATDGTDRITVVVVADGIPSAECTYDIDVDGELRPEFSMNCEADPRLPLKFDEGSNGYLPSTFIITTEITNIGDALARDCEVVFVGPRKFETVGPAVQAFATSNQELPVGDTYTATWEMRALRQEVASSETMIFQVRGRGGLTNDIVLGECHVPITIPPAETAAYTLECSSPAKLTYDPASGSYVQDPFFLQVKVTNTGKADGRDIAVAVTLPVSGRVFFDQSESGVKTIDYLPMNASETLTWALKPVSELFEETVEISAAAEDVYHNTGTCKSETIIPAALEANMELACNPQFDALTVNTQIGDYEPENPFEVYLTVTNTSDRPIYDVYAELVRESKDIQILDPDVKKSMAIVLQPDESAGPIAWKVGAKARTESGDVYMHFRTTASNVSAQRCRLSVYIPEIGRPRLDCTLSRTVDGDDDHYLDFDTEYGDYEGEDSGSGYRFFTLNVNVMNVGEAMADQVRVRITPLDGGAALIEGEEPTKSLKEGDDIIVNGAGHASWKFRPLRQAADKNLRFEVAVTSANADLSTCIYELTVQGAPKVVDLSLPEDIVGQYGDKIAVPIHVSPTIGRDVNIYKLNIMFDPDVVQFVGATNEGSQTQFGWNGPRASLFTVGDGDQHNVVRIQDFTTGSPLASRSDGNLVYLIFEAVYGGDDATKLNYSTANLGFIYEFTDEGQVYRSSMNSIRNDQNGDVTVNLIDGLVTVSGSCIVPLNSSLKFQLAQNVPNPFNPSTKIGYTLPFDTHVTIDVLDIFGRKVRTLVDKYEKKGSHEVVFSAEGLPSGIYFYRMEAPSVRRVMKMVISK